MAQVINTNSLSLLTQNNLNKSQSALGTAIERLSSGLRINSAKDDAAGQAIANRFTANIKGLTQASRNANDGISIAQTTEGALNEINNNLQRVRELAVQSANGTNSQSDLDSIQAEITQRLNEIDRVSGQTQFNGVKVLAQDNTLTIQVGANDGETIDIDLKEISSKTLGLDKLNVQDAYTPKETAVTVDKTTYKNGTDPITAQSNTDIQTAIGGGATGVTGADKDNTSLVKLSFEDKNGKVIDGGYAVKMGDDFYAATYDEKTGAITAKTTTYTDGTGVAQTGAVKFGGANGKSEVVTATDGKTYLASDLDKHNFRTGGELKEVNTDKTENPLQKIDAALAQVDTLRSDLGAVQNRFNSAITNLGNTVNNLSSARSRIEDSDYATEVSNMSRAQILQQAGTSVLAQANQVPQNVLSLLR
ncbi:flagellin [Salmonella enterica subsp. enterica serovar Typhi]|uniref:Flagellin n=1 Tax=Salmonella enterica TaxID=28901 RepID=Q6V2R9_SALER|nr:FliC/FljB family flagellin [Salmonella enterica]AAR10645.1 phase 1 flagellin [Salmonella enterica]AAR10646.1 phase 1 flagellin [Salmonella enterica]QVP70898.1 flagellin FliC [Salmonella enterica subsp. enterica serovar Typhi]CGV62562.1 flagellin [Salmonella enterica subsp. enterica serovar Typhi]CGX49107.1 flagellin [Salmonella enterica subsp. enterica serovar Typhi]